MQAAVMGMLVDRPTILVSVVLCVLSCIIMNVECKTWDQVYW